MSKKKIHRGEILKRFVKNSGIAVKVAAQKAGYSRSAYYKHIEMEDLPLHVLLKYGRGLDFDFSQFVPEIRAIDHREMGYPATNEEAIERYNLVQEKHSSLLEKYSLLQEKHSLLQEKYYSLQNEHSLLQEKHSSLLKKYNTLLEERNKEK